MNKFNIKSGLFVLFLSSLIIQSLRSQPPERIDEERFPGPHRQFDFWNGAWEVDLRRKDANGNWREWKTAVDHIYPVLDGKAVLELWEDQTESQPRILGYSIRYYDPDSSDWHLVLHWPQAHRSGLSGLRGTFRHGRGTFSNKRPIDDSTILISRYIFSDICDDRLRWHDNYSRDGGNTWSESWIMEFTGRSERAPWPSDKPPLTYSGGGQCTDSVFNFAAQGVEHRSGTINVRQAQGPALQISAQLHSYPVVGGCALLHFLEFGSWKYIIYETWNTYIDQYELGVLDNRLGTPHKNFYQQEGEEGSYFYWRTSRTATRERMKWYRNKDGRLHLQLQQRGDNRWETVFTGELIPE